MKVIGAARLVPRLFRPRAGVAPARALVAGDALGVNGVSSHLKL